VALTVVWLLIAIDVVVEYRRIVTRSGDPARRSRLHYLARIRGGGRETNNEMRVTRFTLPNDGAETGPVSAQSLRVVSPAPWVSGQQTG
jgi:hypothetical protein